MTSESIGQIESIILHAGWKKDELERPTGGASMYLKYHPEEQSDTQFAFFYRGKKLNTEESSKFRNLLQKPAHVLSPAELDSIKSVLRDKQNPNDFKMLLAKTEEINGKKVLIVEGHYKEIAEDNRTIFVDADGTGAAVQEIFFQAPKAQYLRYFKSATSTVRSIEWKDSLF
jgi:hypothetical protein